MRLKLNYYLQQLAANLVYKGKINEHLTYQILHSINFMRSLHFFKNLYVGKTI